MDNPVKLGVIILAVLLVGSLAWSLLSWIAGAILGLGVKIAIVVAIALIVWGLVSGKALGGGRNRLP